MRFLGIDDIPWDRFGERQRRVFCRVDYNVPIKSGKILDDYRIRQTIPTIQKLLEKKAVVVLGAHRGRPQDLPENERKDKLSLLPVAEKLAELLEKEVWFSEESTGSGVRKLIRDAKPGENIILLENLRFYGGEEKDDALFAEKLFENCDIYINDAFGACHRAHASIHAVAQRTKARAMGELLRKEHSVLTQVLKSPEKPQMAVLGGAKISDKIDVIEQLMKSCRKIFVGGRMGLSFLAAQGKSLGGSQLDSASIQTAKRLAAKAKANKVQFFYPLDGRTGKSLDAETAGLVDLETSVGLTETDLILDVGPKTIEAWKKELSSAKSVVWNGPMGVFENPAFSEGTLALVDFFVEKAEEIKTIAGGGETVAAITQREAREKLFHVSTGGGAMLEFIEGKELPGIEVLKLREREIEEIGQNRMAS